MQTMRSQEPNTPDIKEAQKELGKRIAQVAEQMGGKRALAEKVGISEGQIYRYINAQSDPTSKVLVRIADIAEISLDWLLKGKLLHSSPHHPSDKSFGVNSKICLKGSTEVCFESKWLLHQRFGKNPSNLQIIAIESDQEMKPTLGINDLVIVDLSKREIGSGIYYIQLGNSRNVLRRLQTLDQDTVRLISDDRAYEPITLSTEKLKILGQVVWIGKECL